MQVLPKKVSKCNRIRTRNNTAFPEELDYLMRHHPITVKDVARILNRTPRTIHDWRTGKRPVPRWAVDLLHLALKYGRP